MNEKVKEEAEKEWKSEKNRSIDTRCALDDELASFYVTEKIDFLVSFLCIDRRRSGQAMPPRPSHHLHPITHPFERHTTPTRTHLQNLFTVSSLIKSY